MLQARRLKVDPRATKSQQDADEPKRAMHLMLTHEAQLTFCMIDSPQQLPTRTMPHVLMELPIDAKPRMLNVLPRLVKLQMDRLEPMRL